MLDYNFSKEDLDKCTEFANSVDTSLYAKRNQWDAVKRTADSKIGKLAELAVHYHMLETYPNISYPDFKIYKPREKSWDYDLKETTFNLHVKAQESLQSTKFGESWIFQLEDKHIFLNHKDNDYVAFVIVNMFNKSAKIKAILPVQLLHDKKLFKKPVLAKLFNKSAVYFEDFKDLELFQLV